MARGWGVTILDNLELPAHLKGKPGWVPQNAEFIQGAVEDPEALERALEGVDAIFHQAAYQGFLPSFSRFWHVNGGGTALIYELIVKKSLAVKKIVIASSQAVYGEGKYHCPNHGELFPPPRLEEDLRKGSWEHRCRECTSTLECFPTNEDALDPRTMYAQTKRAQETIALELGRTYQIPTVILRYAITQGSRQSIYHAYSGVCSIFSTRIINNLPPIIYEDGRQLRDYVYVGDVADANLFALDNPRTDYQAFNVGTGISTSVLEFVRLLAQAFGREVRPKMAKAYRLGDIRHFRCDNSKLRHLGFVPKTSLAETLRRYVAWIREQGEVRDYFSEAETEMRRLGVIRGAND
jgi:dTDP-L-rhamnose 4-epimerase